MLRTKLIIAVASALVAAGGTTLAYNEVKNADPAELYSLIRESALDDNQKDFLLDVLVAATLGADDAEIRDRVLRSLDAQIIRARIELSAVQSRTGQYPNLEASLQRLEFELAGLVAAQARAVPLLNRADVPQDEFTAEFTRIVMLLNDPPELGAAPPPAVRLDIPDEEVLTVVAARSALRWSYWWGIIQAVGGVGMAVVGAIVTILSAVGLYLDLQKKRRGETEEEKPRIILPGA